MYKSSSSRAQTTTVERDNVLERKYYQVGTSIVEVCSASHWHGGGDKDFHGYNIKVYYICVGIYNISW